jgi:hypothetical protein
MKPKKNHRQKPGARADKATDSGKKRLKMNLQPRGTRQELPPSEELADSEDDDFFDDEDDDEPTRAPPIIGKPKGVKPIGKSAALRASETAGKGSLLPARKLEGKTVLHRGRKILSQRRSRAFGSFH